MGRARPEISDELIAWIKKQPLFFIATAPLSSRGHVNVSPKGYECLAVLSSTQVAYLDFTGSGVETIAHVNENGRVILMFCSFDEGLDRILRLWGRARVVEPGEAGFEELRARTGIQLDSVLETALRSIVLVDVYEVETSCGFVVPIMKFESHRPMYHTYWVKKLKGNPTSAISFQNEKNVVSKDGLLGLRRAQKGGKIGQALSQAKAIFGSGLQPVSLASGFALGALAMLALGTKRGQ